MGLKSARAIKVLIVLVWLGMTFYLVQRSHTVADFELSPSEELADSESWMSVYFQNQKVGYTQHILSRTPDGYMVNDNMYLRLNLMGQVQDIRTMTTASVSDSMELLWFRFYMSAGPVTYQLSGLLNGLELQLTGMTGGQETKSVLKLEEVPRLTSGLMDFLGKQGLEKGKKYRLPVFDPATLSSRDIIAEVEDKEVLVIDDREVETFRLGLSFRDTHSYTWVDDQGRIMKEEGLLGLSMVRSTMEKAREGLAGSAELADVVAATSVVTVGRIEHPREVRYLRARLSGVDLTGLEIDGGRQRLEDDIVEVVREKIDVSDEAELPINSPEFKAYMEETGFIQTRHPLIVEQAQKIAAGSKSPLMIIDAVNAWLSKTMEKRPTMSVPSALEILQTKVGDCNEHAVLAAALLRASGIPCRLAVGVLYFNGRFYYHAWLEVYWGRWMAVDPLLNQAPADATHIRFLTGGLDKQADMVRVIGRLHVEILDVK
jgi:hypothetical protein